MAQKLTPIEPLHPPMIPPVGSKQIGITPDGRVIYQLDTPMVRAVPKKDPITGEEVWERHPVSNVAVYQRFTKERWTWRRTFVLVSLGNNNLTLEDWHEDTPDELAQKAREKNARELLPALAQLLADNGMTAANLSAGALGSLLGSFAQAVEEDEDEDDVPEPGSGSTEYPKHLNGNRWELSDGSVYRGKKADAAAAERMVQEEAAEDPAVPAGTGAEVT